MNTSTIGEFFDFDQTLLDTESSRLGFKYLWERRLVSLLELVGHPYVVEPTAPLKKVAVG